MDCDSSSAAVMLARFHSSPSESASCDDARRCAQITEAHARTFSLASRFLPDEKRRAANAIYAFCRVADDLVDDAGTRAPSVVAEDLRRYADALADALDGRANGPIFRELARASRRFAIPGEPLHALLEAIASDLAPHDFVSWHHLAGYCAGVASTVGEMCAHIFGVPEQPLVRTAALSYARTLGVAMQLTNILRDVGEDARRGRCYLPRADLETFGTRGDEIVGGTLSPNDARWRALMAFEIGRARSLYEAAAPGLSLVDDDARRCARLCATGYAAILGAIERNGYDSLTRRARINNVTRAMIVWRSRRSRMESPPWVGLGGAALSSPAPLLGGASGQPAADA
ncbi:MAG: phytoene/squalene synthase family protein [Gemmatimonadaceae bacterium]